MSLKIVVLAKQVPDTRNVGKDAMNADGTINRAALPAIFNPEDLNALEQALRLKDTHPGSTVTILTMGPGRAAEIIREGLYRGADNGYLLTDRAFAGADTLATSYALATAIRKIGEYDLIIGGRQAIDGDTAQVGPEMAEILGLPHVAYVKKIREVTESEVVCEREIETGVEVIRVKLPAVLTVLKDINVTRLPSYRMKMEGKEKETPVWGIADLGLQENQVGMEGSVTTVMKTFTPDPRGNCRMIEGSEEEMIGALLPVIEAVQ